MTEEQIKHMTDRFLAWKLPEDFRPDGGVEFDADAARKLNPINRRYEPYGTNLLDARQAEAMIRHLVAGLPEPTKVAPPQGCICPPGAELGCQGVMCPRRGHPNLLRG